MTRCRPSFQPPDVVHRLRGSNPSRLAGAACWLACMLVLAPVHAASVILLDNTGNLDTGNLSTNSQTTWGGTNPAYSVINGYTFKVGADAFDVFSVSIPLLSNNARTPTMRISLWKNASLSAGKPANGATPLHQEDFPISLPVLTYQYFTFTPSSTWSLEANTNYSIGIATDMTEFPANAFFRWVGKNPQLSQPSGSYGLQSATLTSFFYSGDGGATFPSSSMMIYGFQLTGTPVVPEPSAIAMALAGLAGGCRLVWRRRLKRA